MQQKELDLNTIAGGSIPPRFKVELEKVMANIADLNTGAKKKRKITIEVTIEPDDERQLGHCWVHVKSKLAELKPCSTPLFFARSGNKLTAIENSPGPEIFPDHVEGTVTRKEVVQLRKEPTNA